MIGTELDRGQGLGNQLFAYVTARAIATERGVPFGIAGKENFVHNIHDDSGMYFMDIDLGEDITPEMKESMSRFDDADDRIYLGTSAHDIVHGIYVSAADDSIHEVPDNTLLYGNLQAESYFDKYSSEIGDWLRVKPEHDTHEYTSDDLCIIHMRCGDYRNEPALFLGRSYWMKGVRNMRRINPDMRFLIITDEVENAHKVLPEFEAITNDIGRDYAIIKNARYLLLSNSSFAVFPAMTSTELKYAIAPKYWARYNVSDGYWASEQNIYSFLTYQDRRGHLFSAKECMRELSEYKKRSALYQRRNKRPGKVVEFFQNIRRNYLKGIFFAKKIIRSLERRSGIIKKYE